MNRPSARHAALVLFALTVGCGSKPAAAHQHHVDASVADLGQTTTSGGAYATETYFKARNTAAQQSFGSSVAISADGNTLAVGAIYDASSATGINGNAADTSVPRAGAVTVFRLQNGAWVQQAYVKASNTRTEQYFGQAVVLSADGNTLVVGATGDRSNATGINGDQTNQSDDNSTGAAYVFRFANGNWAQEAYVKASNTESQQYFGNSLALSADGNSLAVGAWGEWSAATGINGDQADQTAKGAGAVYVFRFRSGAWAQEAYVKASNTRILSVFGYGLAMSADGNTLAVGAADDTSAATGVNGDQNDTSAAAAGAAYVYRFANGAWAQEAYLKASNTMTNQTFGWSLALSADGNTLAVGAPKEASCATGINGDGTDTACANAGAAYLFHFANRAWAQDAYVKPGVTQAGETFGTVVTLSADGNVLAVGAQTENSASTGLNGDATDISARGAGCVYAFARSGSNWTQVVYLKPNVVHAMALFGTSLSLSSDGTRIAVAAPGDASNATGVNGNASDTSAAQAGAAYVFSPAAGTSGQLN